jgi:hypothetical protein
MFYQLKWQNTDMTTRGLSLMKMFYSFLLCVLFLAQTVGCGGSDQRAGTVKGGGSPKTQSQNGQSQNAQSQTTPRDDKAIDTELKQQMNMYMRIKRYEYEEMERQRKLDQDQLKKLIKARQSGGTQSKGQQPGSSGGQGKQQGGGQKKGSGSGGSKSGGGGSGGS